ncbi:hypothetical protein [Pseudomonas protegens]
MPQQNNVIEYDHISTGGGTAGCVRADKLCGGDRRSSTKIRLHRSYLTVRTEYFATKVLMNEQRTIGLKYKHENQIQPA